jgi:hypothetical protein
MSRIMTFSSRAFAIATAIVAIGVFAAPQTARASGEYGYFAGSTVYCNGYYNNNLEITARFGRYSGFSSQWIAYSHYVRNIDTGVVTQLHMNNLDWFSFNDYQPFNGVPWATANVTQSWLNQLPLGRYRVFTKYAWYSGYWVYSGWIEAAHYNSYGYGTTSYCHLAP